MSAPSATSPAVERAARIVLRPIGNPLPLGFLALAGGTLVVSGLQLGWLEPTEGRNVALILLAFVFPLQLVTSIFGYLARDVVAGTAMGILAGSWLSIGLIQLTNPPGSTSDALGLFLLVAGLSMLVPAAATLGGKVVPLLVLSTAGLRFAATGLYQLTDSGTWEDIAGYIGLVLCGLALYAALAMALEDARRSTLLPVLRSGPAQAALDGDLGAQLAGVEREAGVRGQL